MERHLTATVYIVHEEKVLLIHHKKIGRWLPPGGHIDPNEMPHVAAIREAQEETGLEVELIKQENIWINKSNARSIPRPFMCLLEEIPAFGDKPAHQHIDQIFIGRPVGGVLNHNQDEVHDMRWFSLEELERLNPEVEIFEETLESISVIFEQLRKQDKQDRFAA